MEDDNSLEYLIRELAPNEVRHLEDAYGAMTKEAAARLDAAQAAERLWAQCAEVTEVRVSGANRSINALQEALLFYHGENPRSPAWHHVISLLLDGLERALHHLAENIRETEGLQTSRAGVGGAATECHKGSDLPLRGDELRPWSLAA